MLRLFHYVSYNISWHKCPLRRMLQLLPGSFSFLQQELQWCLALKFFIASSPRLAGPNTISYDLRNKVHRNITCIYSLSSENFRILKSYFPLTFFPQLLSQRDLSNFHRHLQTAHEEKVKSDTFLIT